MQKKSSQSHILVNKWYLFNYDSIMTGRIGYPRPYDFYHRPTMIKVIKYYVIWCYQCQINKASNLKPQGMLRAHVYGFNYGFEYYTKWYYTILVAKDYIKTIRTG